MKVAFMINAKSDDVMLMIIGNFSIDDGDGSENVTFKGISVFFSNFVAFTPIR